MNYDLRPRGVIHGLCNSRTWQEREKPRADLYFFHPLYTSLLPREARGNRPSDFSHMKTVAISWKCIFKKCGILCGSVFWNADIGYSYNRLFIAWKIY